MISPRSAAVWGDAMKRLTLTPEERLVYQKRLDDARAKYHAIMLGENVEQFVDQNGEQVKYSKINIGGLESYITKLEGLLDPQLALARQPRPFGFLFR